MVALTYVIQRAECTGFKWKSFGSEGLQGSFGKKLLETSSVSDRANASQLLDGPIAGQGQSHL